MSQDNRQQQDQVFDHEFDGIQEYDNRLPNWWLYTLYGAIVFAVIYWFAFHTTGIAPLPEERYELEMVAAAEAQLKRMEGQELTNESLQLTSTVPARVEAGQQVFQQFCVVCHQADGSGNVGPNLTDAYWIHGGKPLDIHDTVTNGVTDKGMAAWGDQLGPRRVQDVVAYVLTLKGKNLPGKAPEGDPETAGGDAEEATTPPAETPADAPAPVENTTDGASQG